MTKLRSMTGNRNHDDNDASSSSSSSRKRFKNFDNDGVASCGVCKSWRSFALRGIDTWPPYLPCRYGPVLVIKTRIDTNNFPKPDWFYPEFVSSGENLYVINRYAPNIILELDIGEMKWVSAEKTIGEYAIFISGCGVRSSAAIKPESWAGPWTQYKSYDRFLETDKIRQHIDNYKWMWYVLPP
ncbi:unnamed protein product [Lactuca virosa]|uniref:F-box domain-containing protein n=1 Tax=Lactuca virosa TaxID=75947 RepID=A0AAU9PGY9_9ASTR|nr:unnamed protein product [Lactuca virosa]